MSSVATVTVTTPTDREVVISRALDAPRAVVFDCYTKPELIKRWLSGPVGWRLAVCDNDLRVGGAYRWVWRGPDGQDMGMRGVYHEIVPPERIVRTEVFDNWPDNEAIGTVELRERDGQTTVTMTVLYPSRQARDGALTSGMQHVVATSLARLAALLGTMDDRKQQKRSA
jgi:uncharacterized protein YndB with AHSA1/START domain